VNNNGVRCVERPPLNDYSPSRQARQLMLLLEILIVNLFYQGSTWAGGKKDGLFGYITVMPDVELIIPIR